MAPPRLRKIRISDLAFWAFWGIVIGGRLGWVLIYGTILCSVTPHYAAFCNGLPLGFLTNPVRIISLSWDGGMSFHGGFLGVVIGGLDVSLPPSQTEDELPVADFGLCLFAPIGLFLGRLCQFRE